MIRQALQALIRWALSVNYASMALDVGFVIFLLLVASGFVIHRPIFSLALIGFFCLILAQSLKKQGNRYIADWTEIVQGWRFWKTLFLISWGCAFVISLLPPGVWE